jgi:hypothetical protein
VLDEVRLRVRRDDEQRQARAVAAAVLLACDVVLSIRAAGADRPLARGARDCRSPSACPSLRRTAARPGGWRRSDTSRSSGRTTRSRRKSRRRGGSASSSRPRPSSARRR